MEKRTITVFNEKHFLLGIDQDDRKVWLQDFEWQCEWYWGGGYLHTLTSETAPEHSKDIDSHYHVDGLMKDCNLYDGFKKHLKECTLTDKELWQLCDWFKVFYTLRESAEVMQYGGHYTRTDWVKKPEIAKLFNLMLEVEVIPAIRALFN